ncbi:MAG: hypothetical protein U0800_01475 [Isosphaeraceae bacterium]
MSNSPRFSRAFALALGALAATGLGMAFQDMQAIEADGLKFQAPAAWKSLPAKGMRKVQLSVPGAADKDAAEFAVFAFLGGAGGVQANLDRWQGQFKGEDGKTPPLGSKKVKSKSGIEVTRVDVKGTYTDPFAAAGPRPQPGYAMLAAIVESPKYAYFLKLTGPEATVKAAASDFDKAIDSVEVK